MGRGETSRRSYGSDRGWTTRPVSSPAHGHPVSHPPLTALWPWRPLCCPPLWFQQRQNTSTSCTGQGGAREHQGRAGMWEWPGAQGGRPLPSLSSLPGHKLAASPLERVPAPGPGLTATAAAFLASPQRSRQSPSASLTPLPHQLGCPGQLPVASPWRVWGGWGLTSRRPLPSGRAARGYSGVFSQWTQPLGSGLSHLPPPSVNFSDPKCAAAARSPLSGAWDPLLGSSGTGGQ